MKFRVNDVLRPKGHVWIFNTGTTTILEVTVVGCSEVDYQIQWPDGDILHLRHRFVEDEFKRVSKGEMTFETAMS